MHDIPAIAPKLATQNIFIEKVRALCKLDGRIDMAQGILCRIVLLALKIRKLLERKDLLLDILSVFFVHIRLDNGVEKFERLLRLPDRGHSEKMRQPCPRMPIIHAAEEKIFRRFCR